VRKSFWVLAFIWIGLLASAQTSTRVSNSRQPKSLEDMIDSVRAMVVQIRVDLDPGSTLPDGIMCPFVSGVCVVRTGFFVNTDGYVVTAYHVAEDMTQTIQALEAKGARGHAAMGLALPNFEKHGMIVAWIFSKFDVKQVAEDKAHDLAILAPADENLFKGAKMLVVHGRGLSDLPRFAPMIARLSSERPRDGQAIFACGFPLGSDALVSTTGVLASAWANENLETARKHGIPDGCVANSRADDLLA
jgi:S1-C subfamily serine protease